MTRYSAQPRERVFVKGYGLLSFPKNIGKNLSSKHSLKLLDGLRMLHKKQLKKQQKQLVT